MNSEELWEIKQSRNDVTMWAMLKSTGIWKEVTNVVGDWITIKEWSLPSEIFNPTIKTLPVSRFSEFDLTIFRFNQLPFK